MKSVPLPRIGMRVVKTAVAVMLSYTIFVPFGLIYNEALGGVWGQLGPLYACIACIICTQSTLGQTIQQGLSRLIGVAVGGALGTATLLLGAALDDPWVRIPALGAVCVAGVWICLLLKRPTACGMACILPCVILITGVTGVTRYYYAAARIIETVVGLLIALGVNAALPDLRPEPKKEAPHMQVEVKNSTKKLCVIGEPVLHSKSPLIQNTMLAALGLDYVYLCQPVPRGRCREWLECAKFAGYAGFNATMPHKEELVELMDELDGDARLFGAVNTVCIRDGRAYGYNTDGAGFLRALNDEGIDPAGKRVLVLGAGGAAKAVCLKLAQAGAEVVVCNRTATRIPCGGRRRSAGCWSTAPPWVWRGRQGSLRSSPSWTPCPPGRRWWISTTPRRRLSCSAGPGRGGTRPPTASDCWSTRRCSPWSTSPARPSTPRR